MKYEILENIKKPDDVKNVYPKDLSRLCAEIRDKIISTVSQNGGHLASNLGTVELTVAIHRVFNSPEDAIIFDVGHQAYTHKLLTGRYEDFENIRTSGGISGFMRPDESEHDPVVTGHSSNSISAAYGIFKAKRLRGEKGTAVAVIGDGAMTGGMAYEAINNAGGAKGNFIVILNDNKMSISKNVGAVARTFTHLRNKAAYHSFKASFTKFLLKLPFGKEIANFLFKIKEGIKSAVYKDNIFANLGFNYLGPVDGHNIALMEELFRVAKDYDRPSVIHVVTKKGKGYQFAETKPNDYHGVSPFDIDEGSTECSKHDFSSVAGETLCNLAEKNKRICAVTAAMAEGTGLAEFSKKFKERFFDVGIAEEHAVTFCAGIAKGGMIPFFAVYSTFLQRGYDQIIHDLAIAKVPVKLLVDRAGIVGEDGETHQGLFDAAFLSEIPNMNVYSPSFYSELIYRIEETAENKELCAIRYPRGCFDDDYDFDYKAEYNLFKGNKKSLAVTYGREFNEVYKAFGVNKDFSILKLNKIHPISQKAIEIISDYKNIIFFEEGIKSGGIAEHIGNMLSENGFKGTYKIKAIDNSFVPSGKTEELLKNYGLDSESIIKAFKNNAE